MKYRAIPAILTTTIKGKNGLVNFVDTERVIFIQSKPSGLRGLFSGWQTRRTIFVIEEPDRVERALDSVKKEDEMNAYWVSRPVGQRSLQ